MPSLPELTPSAINRLIEYDWPGNVRELENVIEREIILNRTGPLTFDHLSGQEDQRRDPVSDAYLETLSLKEIGIRHINHALEKTKGKIHGPDGAAQLLAINPSTLRSRMEKLGIHYKRSTRGPSK